ncbi:hypothetical protein PsorP6_003801 [Peronosclerospora sorghi]|uniref:Uncharacterized protein n=1 Tax=Peronosclerospora sorghi TaxID=230839 RepID=A0ACC0VQW5_9STRA|nr:hypothetical protein PsorP6_003801 [Peronosclerospora sorghi]
MASASFSRSLFSRTSTQAYGCVLNPFGPKSDMFALGIVLYILLCGSHPFGPTSTSAPVVAQPIATGGQNEKYPLKKLKRIAAASTKNSNTIHTGETLEMKEKIVPETQQLCPSKHESGQRAHHLVEKSLLSSGSPL